MSLSSVLTETSCTPNAGRITLPDFSNCSVINFTSLDGIPKPIPSAETLFDALAIFDSLIPISLPSLLISAPPLLPGLIAASVWITVWFQSLTPSPSISIGIWRFTAETIPLVTVFDKVTSNGDPIAKAVSPTAILSLSAKSIVVLTLSALIFNTARSVQTSVPTTSAVTLVPSLKITDNFLAPFTTWLLVTM